MSANVARHFFARVARVIRLPDGFMLASGMNTTNETCAAEQEGASRWTRGGTGVASYEETCLKGADDLYTWTTGASGGTVGLAAHIADTSTHGISSEIVGRTEVQTLTNKTLTSPAITTPTGIVKGDVGLGNVDNTSDATKNAASVTLTNKTLTSPVIADFTNMGHDHLDADDGGTLSAAAIASGTIATARLGSGVADSLVFLRGDQTWSEAPLSPGAWPAAFVDEFGTLGTGNGQFTTIRGIAVNAAGDVYVTSDNRIQKFAANGTYTSTIAASGSGNGQVSSPAGMAFDRANRLFVADSGNHRIQYFTADAYTGQWGSFGTGNTNFDTPMDITQFVSDQWFVLDHGNDRVVLYTNTGTFVSVALATIDTPTILYDIVSGRTYETSPSADVVYVIANPTSYTIGGPGAENAQFANPHSVRVDARGNIYVTDEGNDRVQVFSADGLYQGEFGSTGTGDGEFAGPTAIAVTKDYIYVADNGNSRVQIFVNPTSARRDTFKTNFWEYSPGTLGTAYAWTNQPAAVTEYQGLTLNRMYVDLTGMTEAIFSVYVNVVGHTTAILFPEYSINAGSTWSSLAASGNISTAISGTGYVQTAWTAIATGAKTTVHLRVAGSGGNATADPQILMASVQFR